MLKRFGLLAKVSLVIGFAICLVMMLTACDLGTKYNKEGLGANLTVNF
jgi:hypothetical protein